MFFIIIIIIIIVAVLHAPPRLHCYYRYQALMMMGRIDGRLLLVTVISFIY